MLVSEVIDRAYNEFLYPSGVNRPTYDKLAAAMDDNDVSFTVTGRVQNIPRDTVVEIDYELMLVDSVVGSTVNLHPTLGIGRGYLETTAVAHAQFAPIFIDPSYSKQAIFNAIKSVIGSLYPRGVYSREVETATVFTTQGLVTLPADATRTLSVVAELGTTPDYFNQLRKGIDYLEFMEFSPPRIQFIRGGREGGEMHIVYKTEPSIPATVADDLDALAHPIPTRLQNYLPMAAAAYLLQGKELPRTQIDEIRRALASQGIQVGAGLQIGNQLLGTFYSQYVAAEADRLREQDSTGIEFVRR